MIEATPTTPSTLAANPRRLRESGERSPEMQGSSFAELLEELRVAPKQAGRGDASPQQMLRQSPITAKDRRVAEQNADFRADVTRTSELRAEARREEEVRTPVPSEETIDSQGIVRSSADSALPMDRPVHTPEFASHHNAGAPVGGTELMNSTRARHANPPELAQVSNTQELSLSTLPSVSTGTVQAANVLGRSNSNVALEVARALTSHTQAKGDQSPVSSGPDHGTALRSGPFNTKESDERKSSSQPERPRSSGEAKLPSPVSKFEQLVRALRTSAGRQSTARVMLNPPDLGRVHVRVMVEGDRVQIGVETEHEAARQMLSERVQKLKDVLERQGLEVERFEVVTHRGNLFDTRFGLPQPLSKPNEQKAEEWKSRGFRTKNPDTPDAVSLVQSGSTLRGCRQQPDFDLEV